MVSILDLLGVSEEEKILPLPRKRVGDLVPTGTLVRSWRVWSMPGLQVPELFTVQVWRVIPAGGIKQSATWSVWAWNHWVSYWDQVSHVRGTLWLTDHSNVRSAVERARSYILTMGGRRWDNQHAISCDLDGLAESERDRWVHFPVDPLPPWTLRWPGPQPWQEQLQYPPIL